MSSIVHTSRSVLKKHWGTSLTFCVQILIEILQSSKLPHIFLEIKHFWWCKCLPLHSSKSQEALWLCFFNLLSNVCMSFRHASIHPADTPYLQLYNLWYPSDCSCLSIFKNITSFYLKLSGLPAGSYSTCAPNWHLPINVSAANYSDWQRNDKNKTQIALILQHFHSLPVRVDERRNSLH